VIWFRWNERVKENKVAQRTQYTCAENLDPLAYLFAEQLGASRDARIHLDVGACLVCILKLCVKRRLPRVPVPSCLTSFLDTND
jgi:hypothetical protein